VRGCVVQAEDLSSGPCRIREQKSHHVSINHVISQIRLERQQANITPASLPPTQIQHSKSCQNAATFEAAAVAVDAVEAVETGEVAVAELVAKTAASARRRISLILTSTWTRL
jgi:hypothetical protein